MNVKTWLPLCLAVVLGLVAAKFARDMMAKNKGGETASGNLTQVVVAKRPIGAGEMLGPENCKLGNVGTDSVPEGSFKSINDLKDRVAAVQMGSGQAVTTNLLAEVGTGSGIQAIVKKGMRAIAVEVNEFSGVGGMLLPGSRVDMLATVPAEQGEMISRTVVQNVQVLAVGQRMISQPEKKGDEPVVFRSVTLLVTPSQAEAVELACNSGRPRLVLRGGMDNELAMTMGVTSSFLRGRSGRKSDPTFSTVKVIRGTVETEVRMDGWTDPGKTLTNTDTKAVSGAETAPATGGNR